jgi:type III pantothenate kinase
MLESSVPLVAVDVGNSRTKLGLFRSTVAEGLPVPRHTMALEAWDASRTEAWLAAADLPLGDHCLWRLSSVNRPAAASVLQWLERQAGAHVQQLVAADLPLAIAVEHPDRVGMDRLVNAVAANRLRSPGRPAVVISVGTAITVDLVSADGAFQGGAILPGIAMAARALHDYTDLLPLVSMSELGTAPPPLGTATILAMRSGLFWGAVGAMRELADRLSAGLPAPQVFLTGGAAPAVASLLAGPDGRSADYVPHLTLAGIALASGAPAA